MASNPTPTPTTVPHDAPNTNAFDVVIVGAGVAGLAAARDCINNGLSYCILEANSTEWIGGRIHTEPIDLKSVNHPGLPDFYKFEHGAAWIHGTTGSRTLSLFDELYQKYESSESAGPKFSETQLSSMFKGCAWTNPEFIPPNFIALYDPLTKRPPTLLEHVSFTIITTLHLRPMLRTYPNLPFSDFAQQYVDWVEESLKSSSLHGDAGVISRLVGWYFHSIESYNGISNGRMQAQDVFHHWAEEQASKVDFAELDQMAITDLLSNPSTSADLFAAFQEYLPSASPTITEDDASAVVERICHEYTQSIYLPLDSALQGCYPGDHSTTKTGMSKLIHLLVKDIETTSGAALDIRFQHLVTTIDSYNSTIESPQIDHRSVITAVDSSGAPITLYAKKGTIVTGSLNSLVKNVQFKSTLGLEQEPQEFQEMVGNIYESTDFVYYKKVMFGFPICWWDNYQTARLVGILQQQSNLSHRCSHSPGESNQQVDKSLDFSQGGYTCLINAASQAHLENPYLSSSPEQHGLSNEEFEMQKVMYGVKKLLQSQQPFCHVNIILESHFTNKQTPVLSASLVGNFAQLLCGVPNHIVQTIVLASLQSLYSSTHGQTSIIPTPLFSRVSQWQENPSILQAYSLITDSTYDSTQRITAAAKYGVFLCGESFDLDACGGIHAALVSSECAMKHLMLQTSTMVGDAPTSDHDSLPQ